MSTHHTWPEVAHYYSASGIEISLIPYKINQFMTGEVEVNSGIYTAAAIYAGGSCVYSHDEPENAIGTVTTGNYTPILQALEDMTSQQLAEIAELDGWEYYSNGEELYGFMNSDGLYGEVSQGNKNTYRFEFGKFTPAQVAKMIEMGIDLFRLIASGQAIRKEAQNG